MQDRSQEVLGVGLSFAILSWLSVGIRIYVRAVMQKAFGLDDWLIVLTLIFFTSYIFCQVGGVMYGTGKHMVDLDPWNAQIALHFWWYCELFYILATSMLKMSVGVFLLRVATNKIHIWIIRLILAGTTLFGSAYFFLAIFQCKPVSAWWKIPIDPGAGVCLGPKIILATTFTASVINSFADWTFGILPFFIVRSLDMTRKQRRLVAGILAFAAIGCIATIVRLPFIMGLIRLDDFLYESVDIAIWSTVEPAIGIVAACVITFRPLLRRILSNSSWGSHSKYTSRSPFEKRSRSLTTQTRMTTSRSYALSQSMPTLRPDYVGNYIEITSAGTHLNASPKEVIGAFNSDTELMPVKYQGPGISKEVRVTFTETDMDFEGGVNARCFEIKESRPQAGGPVMVRPSVSHGKLQKPQHHR